MVGWLVVYWLAGLEGERERRPYGTSVRDVASDCIEHGRRERDAVKGARKMTAFPRS
jgi:hypothetical protein